MLQQEKEKLVGEWQAPWGEKTKMNLQQVQERGVCKSIRELDIYIERERKRENCLDNCKGSPLSVEQGTDQHMLVKKMIWSWEKKMTQYLK